MRGWVDMRLRSVMIIALAFCFLSFDGDAAEWIQYAEVDGVILSYDREGITINGNLVKVRVWWDYVLEEARDEYVDELRAQGFPTDGYENFSYTLKLREYDCQNRKTALVNTVDYNDQGKVLDLFQPEPKIWRNIIPESAGELLYTIACDPAKKKPSTQ